MFSIERIEHIGNSKFMVAGRNCSDHADLKVTDRLRLFKNGAKTDLMLKIEKIEWYGREVTSVAPGHTAGLVFHVGPESQLSLGDTLNPS